MQIWKNFNKKTKQHEWCARFRLNKKTFRPKEKTKDELLNVIAEIRSQENKVKTNKKYNLNREVVSYIPTVADLFEKVLPVVQKEHQRKVSDRVFESFLALIPPMIKVNELSHNHFQIYLNYRLGQVAKQSKQPIKPLTAYKEMYAITSALKRGKVYYEALEKWQIPGLPPLAKGYKKKNKRERLVSDKELSALLSELLKPATGRQTKDSRFHRTRLAHILEFGYWTGLRRSEIAILSFAQYDDDQQALLNVHRLKTDTITKFFPLGKRAIEIINERKEIQDNAEYIFSPNGKPIEGNYRTLKSVCQHLKIPYGRYTNGGFVIHDLRHNFGTEILRESDIETARELLGHSNISQTATYVHTSTDRMRDAVRKRDKIDYNSELEKIFESIENKKVDRQQFIEKMKELFRF